MPLPTIFRRKSIENVSKENAGVSAATAPPKSSMKPEIHRPKDNNVKVTKLTESAVSSAIDSGVACPLGDRLSHDDIKLLFSGAPHFSLVSGADGRPRPEILFPWNSELEIADLLDRRLISHGSFTPVTLHAHLPISPHGHSAGTQREVTLPAQSRKRPAFELGVFEVPNMLNYPGKEPGTIGMRHFLELPIGDSLRTVDQVKEQCVAARIALMTHLTSSEALKAMKLGDQTMDIGKNAPWRDRQSFVQDQRTWKAIGVRDISMDVITARTAAITPWYNKMAKEGWRGTILDHTDVDTCYEELFTMMLHRPSQHPSHGGASTDQSLGVQISALTNVLSTPGAWIDFSLSESRLRFGEILWEVPDCSSEPICGPDASRHWLLVQILLGVELAIRLDATLRDQKVHHSEGDAVPELKAFHSLRTRKVDWDLVMARAFLDNILVEDHAGAFPHSRPKLGKRASSRLFSKWRQHVEDRESHTIPSSWDFVLTPRDLELQVDGLLKFAAAMHWPSKEEFELVIRSKLHLWNSATSFEQRKTFVGPLQICNVTSAAADHQSLRLPKQTGSTKNGELRVRLEPASEGFSGGWLSRSWFMGLVLPGESGFQFVMSALLEHDPTALNLIGENADLHGGFLMNGKSWWSKSCIVGKVMAAQAGGAECMGWIYTPGNHLLDQSGEPLPDGWFTVGSHPPRHDSDRIRINAGRKVAEDSHPLGAGRGIITGTDFICARDRPLSDEQHSLNFGALLLRNSGLNRAMTASLKLKVVAAGSTESTVIDWDLTHDVHFVSAHACRVPDMRAFFPGEKSLGDPKQESSEALHSHLLHKSFRHSVKTMHDLVTWAPEETRKSSQRIDEVYVVDARGKESNEVLVRAWCSKVGRHALVSRMGRTCLSCSIREASALAISVVIRISRRV